MTIDPAIPTSACHSDEAEATLRQAGDYADQVTREVFGNLGSGFNTALRTAEAAAQVFADTLNWWSKSSAWGATKALQLAQAGAACRTPQDLVDYNQLAVSGFADFMALTLQECEGLAGTQSRLLAPLLAEVADIPERSFRAVADCQDSQLPPPPTKRAGTKTTGRKIDIREVA